MASIWNHRKIALAAAGAGLFLTSCSVKDEKYEIGYIGKARTNPFLAAGMFLERYGYGVEHVSGITELPPYYHAIVIPSQSVPSYGGAARLRQWIERGGHLIYLVAGGESFKDGTEFDWKGSDDDIMDSNPLLTEFGLELVPQSMGSGSELQFRSDQFDRTVKMPASHGIRHAGPAPPRSHDFDIKPSGADSSAVISMEVASGRLTVIAHAWPLRNRQIGEHDHAELLLDLIELHDAGEISFVFGTSTSFWDMLLARGWMPLLALALLVIFWLWKNLPRFGPMLPVVDGGSRQFNEHISMAGRFLWKARSSAGLLAPIRSRIIRCYLRKHPHHASEDADHHLAHFAAVSGLTPAEVDEAFYKTEIKDATTMIRMVRHLQRIQDHL